MSKVYSLLLLLCSSFLYSQTITIENIENQLSEAINIGNSQNPEEAIRPLKKIIRESENINYKDGVLSAKNALMHIYYFRGDNNEVISISNDLEKESKNIKDYELLANVYRLKGASYKELGFYDKSNIEIEKALYYAKKISNEDKNYRHYSIALIYNNLAGIKGLLAEYHNLQPDSVKFYIELCLNELNKIDDNDLELKQWKYNLIALEYVSLGMMNSKEGKSKIAEEYFLKAFEIYIKFPNPKDEVTLLSKIADFYYFEKKFDLAIKYAQLGIEAEKKFIAPKFKKEIYKILFKSYLESGNVKESKKYSNLYTVLNDSLSLVDNKAINLNIQNTNKEKDIEYSNKVKVIYLVSVLIIFLLLVGAFIYNRRNNIILHKKYKSLIDNIKKEKELKEERNIITTSEEIIKTKNYTERITDETVISILKKLEKFEKSQKFTKRDTTISTLASSFGTNTKYLSEIIKKFKDKNYNDYINGLRIQYITEQLFIDLSFREYKISYLAECSGFSSRETFTIAFKKETGMTPSFFINNLKNEI